MPRAPPRARDDRLCVIRHEGRDLCVYPLDESLGLLGRKWAVLLLAVLGNEPRMRFGKLQAALPGIGPRVLTDRLQELERAGLVRRQLFEEIPPRTEYSLTEEGERFRRALVPLLEWAVARGSAATDVTGR